MDGDITNVPKEKEDKKTADEEDSPRQQRMGSQDGGN